MLAEIVKKYASPVPRYTSYPTAQTFDDAVTASVFEDWLGTLEAGEKLALYVHIPFCRDICWYCACTTKGTRKAGPVSTYLDALAREIAAVSRALKARRVAHIHWGGGSPNILSPASIIRLGALIDAAFDRSVDSSFSVELDPRGLSQEQVAAFAEVGVTRASIGVQDFDPAVQQAINRIQSFETTERAANWLRASGIRSINVDLVYGLPGQTRSSVEKTVRDVLRLAPERIASFGYAHLPSHFSHQRRILDAALPAPLERLGQFNRISRLLQAAGYERVGMDHFAKASDSLSCGPVIRNFQGYSTEKSAALIGLGASAISRLPQGYAQNAKQTGVYEAAVASHGLATARGYRLNESDRVRAFVIEALMCTFEFDATVVQEAFGSSAAMPAMEIAAGLLDVDNDGLLRKTQKGFAVTAKGRPFVRSIAACFDEYYGGIPADHAAGV